jgi:PAS domain S-box-containing protein
MTTSRTKLTAPFRELFELSPDAIFVFVAGVVVQANPAAVNLLRAEKESDLVGLTSRDVICADDLPEVGDRASVLMSGTAKSTRAEERYVRRDGTLVDVEVTAARAPFFDGKAFVVIARDITDRKESEARLLREREAAAKTAAAEEREGWLREIIDLLPLLVYVTDLSGKFVLVNKKATEFFGLPAEAILGKAVSELGFPEQRDVVAAQNRELLAGRSPLRLPETTVVDPRGRTRIFDGVKLLLRRGDGDPVVLGALTELTERRDLQERLLHAQKMESVGRLAGGVAHDFNNLLSIILESTDHLRAVTTDPEGDLERIHEASTRAAALTRQLLTFAHRAPSRPRPTSIDALVSNMARLLVRVLGEDITLEVDLGAGSAHAHVDENQLELVLMNVAVNARDAMPGGGRLRISTAVRSERLKPAAEPVEAIVLEVRDTGVGMNEATRKRVFEPFFTTKGLGAGTGLGLSTSYGIVEQLGGRIEVASEVGKGTCVSVALPTARNDRASKSERPPPPDAKPPTETVLLLEDEPAVRTAISRMLRSLGYNVLEAALPS